MFASLFTALPKTSAQLYPILSFSPKTYFAVPGEEFNASVVISNIRWLYTYQIYVVFSPEILEVVRVIQGDFLRRGQYNTFWQPKWNNTKGEVQIWETLLSPDPESSGSGELFKITFRIKKPGGSFLNFTQTKLIDPFKALINHETEDGVATTIKLDINPEQMKGYEYEPGRIFDVNLTLMGVIENFYGYNVTIKYDKEIINATSVVLVPLLAMPNANFTYINSTEGTILLSVMCEAGAPSTDSTGLLATITFEVLTVGKTSIEFLYSQLFDVDGNEIVHVFEGAFLSNIIRNVGILSDGTSLSPLSVTAGENLTLSLKVINDGVIDETISVIVYAVNEITAIIGGPVDFVIPKHSNQTIEMNLSTNGLEGNYTIVVLIPFVPDEIDLTDNEYEFPSPVIVSPKITASIIFFDPMFYGSIVGIVIIIILTVVVYLRRKRNLHKV